MRNVSRLARAMVTLLLVLAGIGEALAESREVAGMITEIKLGGGRVEVKGPGTDDWRPAGPLMSLLAGDEVRASEGAAAVVLLSGGRGIIRIEAGADPVAIPAPEVRQTKTRKVQAILSASFGYLSGRAHEVSDIVLGTRGIPVEPIVLTPRNSPVLDDAVAFEWVGSPSGKYTLEIEGPSGVVFKLTELPRARIEYPSHAPTLRPGVRYTVRVIAARSQRVDRAWFEVLSREETQQVRESLASLNEEGTRSIPPNTLVTVRAGYLANRGLLHEARRELMGAIAQSPNEATLRLLLGHVASQIGLGLEARQAFDEARRLMGEGGQH